MRFLVAEDQKYVARCPLPALVFARGCRRSLAGWRWARSHSLTRNPSVDIAILDIEMPIKTGLEVLEWAKSQQPQLKVVIVTTFKRPGYFERALKAGVDAYVLKERRITDLMATLHTV